MFLRTRWLCLFVFYVGHTCAQAENWPAWRGADRTDVSKETGLLKAWPEQGPELVWLSKKCGVGYSGFAVVDENV